MSGLFITFEGIEGSGKSTQAEILRVYLEDKGIRVDMTREPGGTPIAEAIRTVLLDPAYGEMDPTAELLLYQAARSQHVHERILPALEAGVTVLCDRFTDSTTAYQGAGRGLPAPELEALHSMATGGLVPDLTILIDLAAEVGLARATRDGESDRIEQESIDFHERVRAGFLDLAQQDRDRVKQVDGQESPERVATAIRTEIDILLAARGIS